MSTRHAPSLSTTKAERVALQRVFRALLKAVTDDGFRKRTLGTKAPWWQTTTHEAALFSHLSRWKHHENIDADSGAHPLVHVAWRALALAYQETFGSVEPHDGW